MLFELNGQKQMLTIDTYKVEQFRDALAEASNITIMAHKHPDGDAVGSALGLALTIEHNKKCKVNIVLPNDAPDTFQFLPAYNRILSADRDKEACEAALMNADMIIGVDFNNAFRVEPLHQALTESKAIKALIDHHELPDEALFSILFSRPDFSSACELVYWVGKALWGDNCLTQDIARCLYTGINTDTGCFAYSNAQPSLYEAVAALMHYDIQPESIYNEINNNFSVDRMRFFGYCINNLLTINEALGYAYFTISLKDYEKFHLSDEDTEGLVNYTLKMKNIHVGALLKEQSDRIRISLRSKRDFDVNQFARTYFEGGGHIKAAGGTSYIGLTYTAHRLDQLLKEALA